MERIAIARQSQARQQIGELWSLHPRRLLRLGRGGLPRISPGPLAAPIFALIALVALVTLVTLLAACGARGPAAPAAAPPLSPRVRAEVELAERAELARDHFTARRHYEAAVAQAVAAADLAAIRFARREFAETLISWGELTLAAAQLEQLVAAAPDDAAAWHDLGLVRHGVGDLPGAALALGRAKELRPRDPRPRIALAALQWKRGERDAARREYQALLELDLPERVRDKVTWAIEQLSR